VQVFYNNQMTVPIAAAAIIAAIDAPAAPNVTGVRLSADHGTVDQTAKVLEFDKSEMKLRWDGGAWSAAISADVALTLTATGGETVTAHVDFSALPGGDAQDTLTIVADATSGTAGFSSFHLGNDNRGQFWAGSDPAPATHDWTLLFDLGAAASVGAVVLRRVDGMLGGNVEVSHSTDGHAFTVAYTLTGMDAADLAGDRGQDLLCYVGTAITSRYWRIRFFANVLTPLFAGCFFGKVWTPSRGPQKVLCVAIPGDKITRSDRGASYRAKRREPADSITLIFDGITWSADYSVPEALASQRRCYLYDSTGTQIKPLATAILKDVLWDDDVLPLAEASNDLQNRLAATLHFTEER
jgi:hypothetical protein